MKGDVERSSMILGMIGFFQSWWRSSEILVGKHEVVVDVSNLHSSIVAAKALEEEKKVILFASQLYSPPTRLSLRNAINNESSGQWRKAYREVGFCIRAWRNVGIGVVGVADLLSLMSEPATNVASA